MLHNYIFDSARRRQVAWMKFDSEQHHSFTSQVLKLVEASALDSALTALLYAGVTLQQYSSLRERRKVLERGVVHWGPLDLIASVLMCTIT
jgi:hypothetical protein